MTMVDEKGITEKLREVSNHLALNDLDKIKEQLGKKDKKVVTKKLSGQPFIRKIWVPNKATGRPYYQRVRHIFDKNGKRKLEVIEHLGTRKPRGK